MCGFVTVVNAKSDPVSSALIERMLKPIFHRGPDDSGITVDGPVGLGFRRLSILDLSPQGHQPMRSQDGRYSLVFNGEIYNYVELRQKLSEFGHKFYSTGDSEVLLTAYAHWGANCVNYFNGMWAFVIHDRDRRAVFGSRDRFGIKPLYRWQGQREMLFASEIKSIRASGLYKAEINQRILADYLFEARLDESNECFFAGIKKLPAGHCFELTLDDSRYREWAFWSLESLTTKLQPHATDEFSQAFEKSMLLHMRSDVPVGVNLSGGLDSSAILCEAARLRAMNETNEPILAFSYQDNAFDESRYIADTLAQSGARLVKLELTPRQFWNSIPAVLAMQDEPVHAMSAVIGYHLSALAQQHGVKVVLNGQGADEVLAGYDSYFHVRWEELIQQGRLSEAWREINDFSERHGGRSVPRYFSLVKQMLSAPIKARLKTQVSARAERQRRSIAESKKWINPDLLDHFQPLNGHGPLTLNATLIRSVRQAPLPLYLRVEDRNSMAHSIESRLPFLDHRLVELAFGMDSELKIRGPWNKFILRESLINKIPESVRSRVDKMGFSTNSHNWLRNELKTQLLEIVNDPSFLNSPLFSHSEFYKLTQRHLSGEENNISPLLKAVQIHLWQQQQGISV